MNWPLGIIGASGVAAGGTANIGVTDESTYTNETTIEAYGWGIPVTMPAAGTVGSISAYIKESTELGSHAWFAVVHDNSGNLVDYSDVRTDITTTAGWVEFTGFSGAALSAAATYIIMLYVSGGSGTGVLYYKAQTSGVRRVNDGTMPLLTDTKATWTPPDPATLITQNYEMPIYLSYDT